MLRTSKYICFLVLVPDCYFVSTSFFVIGSFFPTAPFPDHCLLLLSTRKSGLSVS